MPLAACRIPKAITLVPTYHTRNVPTVNIAVAVTSARTIAAINFQAVTKAVRLDIKAAPREATAIRNQHTKTGHHRSLKKRTRILLSATTIARRTGNIASTYW